MKNEVSFLLDCEFFQVYYPISLKWWFPFQNKMKFEELQCEIETKDALLKQTKYV